MMAYSVTVLEIAPQFIAAAQGHAAANEVPATMLGLLSRGWDFVRKSGVKSDGINVAIYRGDGDGVAIAAGPRVIEKFEGTPAGRAAAAIHLGPYEQLGRPHRAIREWCAANGHTLEGTSWEIYGHHEDDPAKRRTDVFYLLR